MRIGLRLAAVGVAFVALVFWLCGGPNLGRTRTAIQLWTQHPASGAPGPVMAHRFMPGVDLLAGVWAISGALFAVSFLPHKAK